MSKEVDRATGAGTRCVSCGAPLTGPYCSQCGERTLEPEALTLRHFMAHTVAHELLHVDGTLWQTLRLLFVHPGQLSLEYAAGRRRPFVNPFRLLLIAIVVYALMTASGFNVFWKLGPVIASVAPTAVQHGQSVEATMAKVDYYGLLRQQLAAKQERVASEAAAERFHSRLAAFAQPLSFTNVVLLAATLHLVFWRQRHRFLEHAAFSMHFVSFVLLSGLVLYVAYRLRFWLDGYVFLTFILVGLWQFAYLTVAIHRFYFAKRRWDAWLLSVAAALLLYVLTTAFMNAVQLAGAAIALALS